MASHHNSMYGSSYDGAADMASPIAAHHTSLASESHHGLSAYHGHAAGNTSRRSATSARGGSSMLRQKEELAAIQAEIEALKERRRQLEHQRKYEASGNAPAVAAAGRSHGRASSAHTSHNTSAVRTESVDSRAERQSARVGRDGRSPPRAVASSSRQLHPYLSDASSMRTNQHADPYATSYSRTAGASTERQRLPASNSQSRSQRSQSLSAIPLSGRPADHTIFIPSEKERLQRIVSTRNAYREMKEAMKASWHADTTLVGGFFLCEDNPKTGTFGRARRFGNIQGQKDQYYLGTDVQLMQEQARSRSRPHFSVSNRGKSGCNVNSHWNDPKGGAAPGPGAYTPRYQKLAPPSILTRK